MGEREALIAETRLREDAGILDVATAIAAMKALGRRQKAMLQAAKRGVEIAAAAGDRRWEYQFQSILERLASGGRRPPSEGHAA